MTRTTSPAGRAALTQREGCRLTAYRDTVGVLTIGVGHSANAPTPPAVREGLTITAAQADEILTRDLVVFEKSVNAADLKGRLSQNAFDASASLCFNIGIGAFGKSTVARLIASGDMQGAADAFLMWDRPAALLNCRKAERAQFLTPDATPELDAIRNAVDAAAKAQGALAAVTLPNTAPAVLARPTAPPHLLPSAPVPAWWQFWKKRNG